MSGISVIHFGHSHLAAMTPYLYGRQVDGGGEGDAITHFVFNTHKYNIFGIDDSRYAFGIKSNDGYVINQEVARFINQTIPSDSNVVIATMFGGNAHNALTLLEVPGGIDVFLPDQPDLPIAEGAEVLPYGLLKEVIKSQCEFYLNDLRGVRSATSGRVFHVMSPPPIEDDAFVAQVVTRDPYFAQLGHTKITPALVRYKMWVVHCSIYADLCKELGVEIIMPPAESVVDGMWLSPDCLGSDPTHGNLIYGERLLKEIERILGGHYAGWHWLG